MAEVIRENPFEPIRTGVKDPFPDNVIRENPFVPLTEGVNLTNRVKNNLQGRGTSKAPSTQKKPSVPLEKWDIAQSHFFTVQIYSRPNEDGKAYNQATGIHDRDGNPYNFASGEGTYKDYLPIKSMNFTYTSYDNMSIPLAVLGDAQLLHRKKVTTINFTCYDRDDDIIESALKEWENQCFPGDQYVEYLDNIKAKLTYTSYDVKGKITFTGTVYVIPTNSVSVSRSYPENSEKLLNFSVVAVGMVGSSSNNANGGPLIREHGYGWGNEAYADYLFDAKTSAILNPSGEVIEPTVWN